MRDRTGITPGPLGQLLRGLEEKGWVTSERAPIEGPGRPAQIYRIVSPDAYTVSVDHSARAIRVLRRELTGSTAVKLEQPVAEDASAAERDRLILSMIDEAVGDVPEEKIWGAGLAVSGALDDDGVLVTSVATPQLEGTRPADVLTGRFECPVMVIGDGRAALSAENVLGVGRTASDMMLLALSRRPYIGTVLDRFPRIGAHHLAGDVSRMSLGNDLLDVSGWAGDSGEDFPDVAAAFRAVAAGDKAARRELTRRLEALADHIAVAISVVDPELVAIGGAGRLAADQVIEILTPLLEKRLVALPRLEAAHLDQFGVALGVTEMTRYRIFATLASPDGGLAEFSRDEFIARSGGDVQVQ
ncbi:ROK family protein [Brachybacterium sp. EF45031]|uniref:ROK family transcriptional regulator n=1 Tax=Brachybacterium sillae TaxID=2810536 RepID=UPI00217D7D0C|nr:ROK family protein [Brachybacterium sillae]MCS6711788.1 ROK family protein [Brachybacterium sillae]